MSSAMEWLRRSARFRKPATLPPAAKRGLPFVFVTGYGERSLPEPYRGRPALQKPFQAEQLKRMLAELLPSRTPQPT